MTVTETSEESDEGIPQESKKVKRARDRSGRFKRKSSAGLMDVNEDLKASDILRNLLSSEKEE